MLRQRQVYLHVYIYLLSVVSVSTYYILHVIIHDGVCDCDKHTAITIDGTSAALCIILGQSCPRLQRQGLAVVTEHCASIRACTQCQPQRMCTPCGRCVLYTWQEPEVNIAMVSKGQCDLRKFPKAANCVFDPGAQN